MPEKESSSSKDCRKRRRTEHWSHSERESDEEVQVEHSSESKVASKTPICHVDDEAEPENNRPRPLIIHQVDCSCHPSPHANHASKVYFLDVPRLYKGDNKTQPLRGLNIIKDLESYREDNLWKTFVVKRYYDCVEYHESLGISSQFLRLLASSSKVPTRSFTGFPARLSIIN